MVTLHPFRREVTQEISWKHLDDKEIYDLELIMPIKGILYEYHRENSGYICFCAKVNTSKKKKTFDFIEKDSLILINFPINAFNRAWRMLPNSLRNNFTEKDNIRLRFEKVNKNSIEILNIEKLATNPNQVEFAVKNYNQMQEYITKFKSGDKE